MSADPAQPEIRELSADVSDSPLYNADIAPVGAAERKWGRWDIAALWVGMAVCIPTYMLASSLIEGGMSWWQAVVTIFLGNAIVLVPMVLVAHAGTRYGIPFPVLTRAAFSNSAPRAVTSSIACPSCTARCSRTSRTCTCSSGSPSWRGGRAADPPSGLRLGRRFRHRGRGR